MRTGPASSIWTGFEILFAVFAILKAPIYTKAMGFQMLLWSYYKEVKHPFLQILDNCPASLVAEDIELSLMILSNYTATTSLSRNSDPLHDCYQKLSLLMNVANKVRDYRISQFGGATLQRSRLHYTEDSVNATKVQEFVEAWIERTARDGLWEYKKPLQAKKGRPKKSNRAEEKSTEKKVKIGKKAAAEKKAQHVFNVPLIDMQWEAYARASLKTGLAALENSSFGKDFTFDFLLPFRSHYAFDDRALLRLLPDSPDTDDSANDVCLLDFVAKMKGRFSQEQLAAMSAEALKKTISAKKN